MICLPNKDPNQYDLFDDSINFDPEVSSAFPPNMQDIMDELAKPDAFLPSPNVAAVDDVQAALDAITPAQLAGLPIDQQDLITGNYNFGADPRFNAYTGRYNVNIPPLLGNTGGIQDIINTVRTHINGVPNSVPGVLGSLGQGNILRTLGYGNAGNTLQKSLGLGAIPDCGLFDKLLGLLKDLFQPLVDLIAALLGPLLALLAAILAILAAILDELLKLLDLIQRLLNFASAGQLLSLDPCAILNMSQIGSPNLNEAVNTGIKWTNPDAPRIPEPGEFF